MLIAVEATRLLREVRGIGRYVRALLPRLVASGAEVKLALFVKRTRDVEALSMELAAMPGMSGRVCVHRVRELSRFDADVFWYPWNVVRPVPHRGAIVATMHDVAPLVFPDPRRRAWQKNLRWRWRYAATARSATLVLTDSSFTAAEVRRVLGIGAERIRVALLAADDIANPDPADTEEVLQRLRISRPFLLTVGAADARKNYGQLTRVMARMVSRHPELRLVQAGPRREAPGGAVDAPWQRTTGFVSDRDLLTLYRTATALVMPSTYEGFGLPVLEAMRLGTPVICARGSSLPEVAGDAALWFDPCDDGQLEMAIDWVVSDQALRTQLQRTGVARSLRFCWDETARVTMAAFEEARSVYRAAISQPRVPLWRGQLAALRLQRSFAVQAAAPGVAARRARSLR